jgi:hypothetical protein
MNKSVIVGFILIILLGASAVTPVESIQIIDNKEKTLESNHGQDDARWFATLKVDFGEEIYNEKIYWIWWKFALPEGDYYINVNINFRCPPDKRIDVSYHIKVAMYEEGPHKIIFCDFEDSFTIINGSNPPDIDEKYVKYCFNSGYTWVGWGVWYIIEADLDVYDFVDGEWVFIDEDHLYKEVYMGTEFYENIPLKMLIYEFLNILLLPVSLLDYLTIYK